jgi:hypothetical protein
MFMHWLALKEMGTAMEVLSSKGKWPGRPEDTLVPAVRTAVGRKRGSRIGTVSTLCVSPKHGSRLPLPALSFKQSIIGDCQSESGEASVMTAKIKNKGALLGKDNLLVESLLCAASVADEEVVKEVVDSEDTQTNRLTKHVWITGDNIYVSGLDLTWDNFQIGDLLVLPDIVLVNTGYPHTACYKYGVRAGEVPKRFVNSEEGCALRVRGIKGAVLHRKSGLCKVERGESVRIIPKHCSTYKKVLSMCVPPPLAEGHLVYRTLGGERLRAMLGQVEEYVTLLITAGMEAARVERKKYRRKLPAVVNQAIDEPLPVWRFLSPRF